MNSDFKEIKRIALYLASKAEVYTFIDHNNCIWGLSKITYINKVFPNLKDMKNCLGPHIAHFLFKEEMSERTKQLSKYCITLENNCELLGFTLKVNNR